MGGKNSIQHLDYLVRKFVNKPVELDSEFLNVSRIFWKLLKGMTCRHLMWAVDFLESDSTCMYIVGDWCDKEANFIIRKCQEIFEILHRRQAMNSANSYYKIKPVNENPA
jgi:vacuolar-type H+-ATPase catalytic subunit A/Vma1